MVPLETGDRTQYSVAIGIQHLDFGAVRKVDAPRGWVNRNVIEVLAATLSRTKGDFLQQVITARWRSRKNTCTQRPNTDEDRLHFKPPAATMAAALGFSLGALD